MQKIVQTPSKKAYLYSTLSGPWLSRAICRAHINDEHFSRTCLTIKATANINHKSHGNINHNHRQSFLIKLIIVEQDKHSNSLAQPNRIQTQYPTVPYCRAWISSVNRAPPLPKEQFRSILSKKVDYDAIENTVFTEALLQVGENPPSSHNIIHSVKT